LVGQDFFSIDAWILGLNRLNPRLATPLYFTFQTVLIE